MFVLSGDCKTMLFWWCAYSAFPHPELFPHQQNIPWEISRCSRCGCCRWWKTSWSWQHNAPWLILLSWGLGEAPYWQWWADAMRGLPLPIPAPELAHGKPTRLGCCWAGEGPRPPARRGTQIMGAHCPDAHWLHFHRWNSTPYGPMTHRQAKGSRRPWIVWKIISLRHGNQSSG